MADLAKYVVSLEAETAKYRRELDKANKNLSKFHRDQRKALDGIRSGFKRLAGAIGTVALGRYIKQSIDAADSANKLSKQIGLATETITGLQLGVKLGGASVEGFEKGLLRLARSASDAAQGLSTQKRAFDDLGVSVVDTGGQLRPLEGILRDVADSFAEMEDGAQKAARAQEIFGRSGAQLIPFLNEGSAGLDRVIDRSERLGLVWTQQSAAAAEQFNDNLTLLSAVGRGFANQVAQEMLPEMNNLTAAMILFSEESEAASGTAQVLGAVFNSLATGVIVIGDGLTTLGKRLGAIAASIKLLAEGEFGAVSDVWDDFNADVEARLAQTTRTIEMLWGQAGEDAKRSIEEQRAALVALVKAQQDAVRNEIASGNQQEAAAKQVATLERQAATLGKTTSETKLYTLAQMGATEADLARASAALEAIDAFEQAAARQKAAREQAANVLSGFQEGQERLQSVMDGLRTEEEIIRESYERRLQIIRDNTQAGSQEQARLIERLSEQTEEQLQNLKDTASEMSEFSKQAARNMQDAFADFLFDPFSEGLDGMLQEFANILRRMAAEAAASAIFNQVGGALGASGNPFFAAIGSAFGGTRAEGGPVSAGRSYLVGERGPEMFTPGVAGQIMPNGVGGVTINQTLNVTGASRSEFAAAAAALKEQTKAEVIDMLDRRGQ